MNKEQLKSILTAHRATIDAVLSQLDEKDERTYRPLSEASAILGKSRETLRRMAHDGMIEHKWSSGGGKLYVLC